MWSRKTLLFLLRFISQPINFSLTAHWCMLVKWCTSYYDYYLQHLHIWAANNVPQLMNFTNLKWLRSLTFIVCNTRRDVKREILMMIMVSIAWQLKVCSVFVFAITRPASIIFATHTHTHKKLTFNITPITNYAVPIICLKRCEFLTSFKPKSN